MIVAGAYPDLSAGFPVRICNDPGVVDPPPRDRCRFGADLIHLTQQSATG
ncbi:MAG: hypothetical protein ACR2P2_18955 [Nakamurella sp.]